MNEQKHAKVQIKIILLIIFAILLASGFVKPADAKGHVGELGLDLNITSYHAERCFSKCTRKFNEFNYGLTGTYRPTRSIELWGGFLKNSFHQTSIFGAVNFNARFDVVSNIRLYPGVGIGLINGYDGTPLKGTYKDTGITYIFVPNITAQKNRFRFNIGLLPIDTYVLTFRAGIAF